MKAIDIVVVSVMAMSMTSMKASDHSSLLHESYWMKEVGRILLIFIGDD